MTRLLWGQDAQKKYEAGVDRGVLYPPGNLGVVWNGLVSVKTSSDGANTTPLYLDGIKYADRTDNTTFKASLSAYYAPAEFAPCNGEATVVPGFILTRQPRVRFGLSYRTLIGPDKGYKIHLIYGCTAKKSKRGYSTIGSIGTPEILEWDISAVPRPVSTFKPTPHLIIDSTKVSAAALTAIENALYGTASASPYLPNQSSVLAMAAL